MIQDKQLELSAAQAITASAASTNQIDTGPKQAGSEALGDVELVFTIDETFAAVGAATLQIGIRSSASADMSSPTVHESSPVIALADLQVGDELQFFPRLPRFAGRYVDAYYTVTTGPFTAGKLTARGTAARQVMR